MHFITSPLKETAGIDFPIALLRVHHRACPLLGLSWIPSLCSIVTLFPAALDNGDCCVGVTGCFF